MAATRRSTRQAPSSAPKYTEPDDSLSDTSPKVAKAPTRRKRARASDTNANDDAPSPPKKAKKAAKPPSKPSSTAPTASSAPAKPLPQHQPTPSNPSNRTPTSEQDVFWLLKAEPLPRYENGINVAFSIADLAACTTPEPWSGVRNPQACANMRAMRKGDLGFFYHSNGAPSGVAGILRVVNEAHVDESAFDAKDPYFDAKSKREKPRWWCVDVEFVRDFGGVVGLKEIKAEEELKEMQLVRNSRLSVGRVRKEEWDFILGMAEKMAEAKKESEGGEEEE